MLSLSLVSSPFDLSLSSSAWFLTIFSTQVATERSWASMEVFFGELFNFSTMKSPNVPEVAGGDIVTEKVMYMDGTTPLEGFLSYSKMAAAKGKLPSVLVSHDWDGITEHEMTYARSLAAQGYLAFASAGTLACFAFCSTHTPTHICTRTSSLLLSAHDAIESTFVASP
jgi:hypothetical protein